MIPANLLAYRNAVIAGVLALGLAGLYASHLMPRSVEPTVSSTYGVVEVRLPGVSAAELEQVITEPVEAALLRLPEVLGCRSETRDGLALIVAECVGSAARSGVAWTSIEDRLDRLRGELGDGFVGLDGPLLHRPSERRAAALITVAGDGGVPGSGAGTSDGGTVAPDGGGSASDDGARRRPPVALAESLAERLRGTEGVDDVEIVGRPREQIVLTYDDRELFGAGLSPLEFREYFRAQHVTAPGAYLRGGGVFAPIETVSRIRDFDELATLPVRDPEDGDPVNLSRLVGLERQARQPDFDRVGASGRPALALAVHRAADTDQQTFADNVRAVLADVAERSPGTCELVVFQPDAVAEELGRFGSNLLQGFVAILVLLVAVLGLRAGLAVACVLPFVVLTSFVILYAAGIGFDIVTLSSFILVLGLLVDNHIVMAERIHRLKEHGAAHGAAVARAVRELAGPLLAAAATTAFGFLPIVLTRDPIGEYVEALFWVVLVTLSVSLAFCFFVTPLLLPPARPAPARDTWLERVHARVLGASFTLALPMLLLVAALCLGGWELLARSDQIFFPSAQRPLWLVEVELAHGRELQSTEQVTRDLDTLLAGELQRPEGALRHWVTFLGRSAPSIQASVPYREFAPHYAQVLLGLDPERDAAALEQRLHAWRDEVPDGVRVRLRPVVHGTPFEWPIQIVVSGQKGADIHAGAAAVRARVEASGEVLVATDWEEPIRKLKLVPDREALAERDLTVADLTVAMHCVLHGLPLFDLIEGDVRTPVVLKASARRSVAEEALSDAYVYPAKGEPSLVYEVADVTHELAAPVRVRVDGRPAVTVRADVADPDRALAREREIDGWLDELREAHPELTFEVAGLSAAARRANRALLDETPWALLLMLLCLLAQSRSLIDTGLILLTIPLSFTGVAIGLWITREPFSFMTLVGMTALGGIVVNNAIVLLASIRTRIEQEGRISRELLIDAASHRLRPILLTSLCALASMTVLYLSGGAMWRPLATAVISGLAFSTLLVLFVLPVLFGGALRLAGAAGAEPGPTAHGSPAPRG